MATHTKVAVIESRWWTTSNTSVRGLYELMSDITVDNPHGYEYEMANSEAAIKEAIPRVACSKKCKYLCIASHGNKNGIHLHNGDKLSRAELRNLLKIVHNAPRTRLHGMHLSSCIFGTKELASFIFAEATGVHWISGYKEKVDWLESSALDLLFFNELVGNAVSGESMSAAINRTAKRLAKIAGGLVEELGFGVYVRKQHVGGAKNIFDKLR